MNQRVSLLFKRNQIIVYFAQDDSSFIFTSIYHSLLPHAKHLRELNIVHSFWQLISLDLIFIEAA